MGIIILIIWVLAVIATAGVALQNGRNVLIAVLWSVAFGWLAFIGYKIAGKTKEEKRIQSEAMLNGLPYIPPQERFKQKVNEDIAKRDAARGIVPPAPVAEVAPKAPVVKKAAKVAKAPTKAPRKATKKAAATA